jgi:type VI protein secretion system component Hcp
VLPAATISSPHPSQEMNMSDPKSKTPGSQPTSTELSAEELDRVTGGDQAKPETKTQTKVSLSPIIFTKHVDKSTPYLP